MHSDALDPVDSSQATLTAPPKHRPMRLEPPGVRLDTSLELLLERAPPAPAERVLATVVATAGSTYRKPGARMLVLADDSVIGLLSGGCLESDLLEHARAVLGDGTPRMLEYDLRGPDDEIFGIGAGCEGAMRILLEPAGPGSRAAAALHAAGRLTGSGSPAVLVAVHESERLPLGTYEIGSLPESLRTAALSALEERCSRELLIDDGQERLRAFLDVLEPPPHLLICGAGPDAQPVCAAARALGWRVTVLDHRPAYVEQARFAGARVIEGDASALGTRIDPTSCHAVVVMSHHLASDVAYLRVLAASRLPDYVGLLGPGARRARIMRELGSAATEALRARLRGPVGLDIGAQTPEAIALSIVSEIHSWLAHHRRVLATR